MKNTRYIIALGAVVLGLGATSFCWLAGHQLLDSIFMEHDRPTTTQEFKQRFPFLNAATIVLKFDIWSEGESKKQESLSSFLSKIRRSLYQSLSFTLAASALLLWRPVSSRRWKILVASTCTLFVMLSIASFAKSLAVERNRITELESEQKAQEGAVTRAP